VSTHNFKSRKNSPANKIKDEEIKEMDKGREEKRKK
jgi:hypothetical protein